MSATKSPSATTYNDLPPFSLVIRALVFRALEIALGPFKLALGGTIRLFGRTAPPLFHIFLLVSLLPLIAVYSIGAGLVVRSWIPEGWKQVVYLRYGEGSGVTPFAEIILPRMASDPQGWDIGLELELPLFARGRNTELGNFMSTITILSPPNTTLAYSSRPSLIHPPPISHTPLIFSGVYTSYSVRIPLIEDFSPPSSYLLSGGGNLKARISVGRNDGWRSVGQGEGKEIVVSEVWIAGKPRLRGIRGFFANHSILLLVLTSSAFFFSTSLATIAVYLYYTPSLAAGPPSLGPSILIRDAGDIKTEDRLIKAEEDEDRQQPGYFFSAATRGRTGGTAPHSESFAGSSVVTGETEETEAGSETEGEGSGSEVDVGAALGRR